MQQTPPKYKNTYRTKSNRLQGYNYSENGIYFITICVKGQKSVFGCVKKGKMILNQFGKIVEEEWKKSAEIRKEIILDEFVVMPNHFHGIVILQNDNVVNETHCRASLQGGIKQSLDSNIVETHGNASQGGGSKQKNFEYKNTFGKQSKNISALVRGFKSSVSRKIKLLGENDFSWQSNYHDHIIRNQKALEKIRTYVQTNPFIWEDDCYFQ